MILDEWNVAQCYSPILMPFYALYRIFVIDNTGVYFCARVIHVVFATTVSSLFYQQCCKNTSSMGISWIAASLLLLYSRANICGPSYYNLCLYFVVIFSFLLWEKDSHALRYKSVLAGVSLAFAVFCNPFLIISVFCGLIVIGINRRTRKQLLGILTGIIFTALIYLFYLFQSGSPGELLNGLSNVLNIPLPSDDPISKLKEVKNSMLHYVSFYVFPVTVLGSVVSLWFWKREKQIGTLMRSLYLVLCLLLIGYTASKSKTSICFVITVPFTILVFPAVIRAFLCRDNDFALIVYVLGVGLAIAFFFASNTGLDAMTTGTCLSSAGGLLLLADNKKRDNHKSRNQTMESLNRAMCVCICLALLGVCSAHRFLGIYRDAPVSQLTHRIENGPAAGLYTTDAHAAEYDAILNEIIKLHEDYPTARVLFSKILPWAYLASDWTCADFTVWSTMLSDPRVEKYYETHQEPDIVFVFDESVAGFEVAPFNNHIKYNIYNRNEFDGPFYDHLMEAYHIIDANEIFTVYCRSV